MKTELARLLCLLSGLCLAGAYGQAPVAAGDPQRALAGELTAFDGRLGARPTDSHRR